MQSVPLLDCAGRRRSPATLSSFHQGLPPRNKGLRYPPDPPTVEEIIAVMHAAGDDPDGLRLRGTIVVLWRAGLRISEALALTETDLDPERGALLVRITRQGRRAPRGRDGPLGVDTARTVARVAHAPSGRRAVLRSARSDTRPAVRFCGDPRPAAPRRTGGRGAPTVRAAPAASCARCGDVPRRRAVARDPAPARSLCG